MINVNTADLLALSDVAGDDSLLGIDASGNAIVRISAAALAQKGNTFYVDSVNGSNANDGSTWAKAVASIDYAVGLCTANHGDVILVAPSHVETVTGAAGVALDVAGVTIRGLGNRQKRPKVNFTTGTGASFDITAAGCVVDNIWFNCGIDAQTAMVNVTAADVAIRRCAFMHGDVTNQAVLGILTTAGADRLTVEECHFYGSTDAGTTAAISLVGGNDILIRNNLLIGAYAQTGGAIKNATTDSLRLEIAGNRIANMTASSTKAIVLTASSTGFIVNNRMAILSGSAPITAAGGYVGGNYYVAAAGVVASALI